MKFQIPQNSEDILFETTLEPTVPTLRKIAKEHAMGENEIGKIVGKKARVAIGVPYFENLVSRFRGKKRKLPHEIFVMLKEYDFHFASLSCCFQPDSKCRIVWARFGITLSAFTDSGKALEEKPIAHDIFPQEVLIDTHYEKEVNLDANFGLSLGVLDADIKRVMVEKKEYVIYEPEIFAYGVRRSNMAWDFRSTRERGIWGNKRDLLLVIRSPKNTKVKAKFSLGAEIEFNLGRVIRLPIALSKRDEKAAEIEYSLSK